MDGGEPSEAVDSSNKDSVADVAVEVGKLPPLDGKQKVESAAAGLGEKDGCVVIDVECGGGKGLEGEGESGESEKFCRICHLSPDPGRPDEAELIWLGCACKGELGTAHRQCAEAWFKLKGNSCCEICGVFAKSITGVHDINFIEEWNEGRMLAITNNGHSSETESCWRGKPFCNFLMACLVIAFILPWFFRVSMF